MPRSVSTSQQKTSIESPQIWILLMGVNEYQDAALPSLQYSALDCQALGETLAQVIPSLFPQHSISIYHDFAETPATWTAIQQRLTEISQSVKAQDTLLIYFSGHGVLDKTTQEAILCLQDTSLDRLSETGLPLNTLLTILSTCAAQQQIIWLDACHSGGMTLRGVPLNPSAQLVEMLQKQALQSQGLYALLSCDRAQQSWEFPELGHGLFTYFLMKGLRGEAANAQGIIDVDGLYKYVYHQTLRYVDQTNQQLRLVNQQKRSRGDRQLQPEYPLQTPKRIVEGVGEFVLAQSVIVPLQRSQHQSAIHRKALIIDGLEDSAIPLDLSKALSRLGQFEVEYYPKPGQDWATLRSTISEMLETADHEGWTTLLYLRGKFQTTIEGDGSLTIGDLQISRTWLRQQLRRSQNSQQILILDAPGGDRLSEWLEELQHEQGKGQCILASASTIDAPTGFVDALLITLNQSDPKKGLSAAGWITQLQLALAGVASLEVFLSGTQGIIEIIPESNQVGAESGIDLGVCPYMGLRAFGERETRYFYGREKLVDRLLQAISEQSVVSVVGASGSGKSSLVQAGLIPQLRHGNHIPNSDRWQIIRMRPGDRPLNSLSQSWSQHLQQALNQNNYRTLEATQSYTPEQIEGFLHQGIEGWVYWLRSQTDPLTVLVVDQFEELFTLSPDEDRRRFLELILGAVDYASDRFKLVLTLRADFITHCLEVPKLAATVQQTSVLVPACLEETDYRRVITQPAEQVGLQVEPELVEVLLQELDRTTGDLPLLQFVLEQLWQYRSEGILTLQSYQKQIGGLRGVLEQKAQTLYDTLDPEAQACTRWIFLNLTQLGDNTEDTRRRISLTDLRVKKYSPELIERTLNALIAAKLIIIDRPDGSEVPREEISSDSIVHLEDLPKAIAPKLEVTHEILIRHWSTLRWWLEENRSRLRAQRQIEQAAQQWQEADRKPEFLLRGVRLAEAEELYIDYIDELTEIIQEFIEHSLEERQREIKETKKRLRRAQITIGLISVLGCGVAGFAGFALWQQRTAQLREIDALTASSEAMLNSQQQIESLTTAITAGERWQTLDRSPFPFGALPEALREKVTGTLQQAIVRTQELNRLEGHGQAVQSAVFNHNGTLIATASDDQTIRLWRSDGTLINTLKGHRDRVTSVAFDPMQERLASGSADKTIKIWSSTGQLLETLSGHQGWITDVQWSADGQWIVSASRDGTLKLWDGKTLQLVRILQGGKGWINAVQMVNAQTIVAGGEDGTVRLWSVAGKLLRTWKAHRERITSIALSPDRQSFLTASGDRTLKRWNLQGQLLQTYEGHTDQVNSVSWQGQTIASVGADRQIMLWSVNGALIRNFQGSPEEITSVQFSPDGKMLLTSGSDKMARLWRVVETALPNPVTVSAIVFLPQGNQFVVAQSAHKLQWFKQSDRKFWKLAQSWQIPGDLITSLAVSPDGKQLVGTDVSGQVFLWQTSGQLLSQRNLQTGRLQVAQFSPQGHTIAIAGEDKKITLLNVINLSTIATLSGHADEITTLQFSPDGQWLASGSNDRQIRLWNLSTHQSEVLGRHQLEISSLAWSPDEQWLASGSWDNTIRLWNLKTRSSQILTGHSHGITGLRFSPDGQTLFSSSKDGTVKLWTVPEGRLIKTLLNGNDSILSMALSPQADRLVFVGDQTGLQQWDFDLPRLLHQGCDRLQNYLRTHPNPAQTPGLCQL